MKKFQTETLVLGGMATNCYLAVNRETGAALVIDPAAQPERIFAVLDKLDARPEAVLLTHGHFDHIGAADAVRDRYRIPVCAFWQEQEILEDVDHNLSRMFGKGFTVSADRFFRDREKVNMAGVTFEVLHTPGHTIGSVCYYFADEDVVFSGDTLFRCSVGRSDFPTGSMEQLHASIHGRLFVLPDATLVLPGHDSASEIGYEKRFNPY